MDSPVMFPPGLEAGDVAGPFGICMHCEDDGIEDVASFKACTYIEPRVTIRSTLSRTKSAASSGSRAWLPSCRRDSIRDSFPQAIRAPAGLTGTLAADFMLPMPTMGAYLSLVHVPRLLRVVGVVLRPRADLGVVAPPSVIVFTEYEAAASLEGAKAHGWELVPGLPQPPEAR